MSDIPEAQEVPAAPDAPDSTAAPSAPGVPDLSPAQCSARLAALFPALFGLQQPLPLKLRIQADIQQRAPNTFNRKSLSAFLHRYTTGTPYLLALTRVPQRFDLDGQAAGEVAKEHHDAAVTEVARRRSLMDARRAAEQAARREAQNAERAARNAAGNAARNAPRSAVNPPSDVETAERAARIAAEKAERAARRAADAAAHQQRDANHQGRRERALLLRAYEASTLTRANFCVLKRIAEADLEAQLVLARKEAAERPPAVDEQRGPPRHERGPQGDRTDRTERTELAARGGRGDRGPRPRP